MKRNFYLQLFAEEGDNGGNNGSNAGGTNNNGASYSYEQAEEIANARAERASRAALTNYFKQQGMSEEEAKQAFEDFKAKKSASAPNVSEIEKQRDEALAEVAAMKNKATLAGLNVLPEFGDFLTHEIAKNVTDKKDFATAAKEYLTDKPQYTKAQGYRVSSGSAAGNNGAGSSDDTNAAFNRALRSAFGRS